MHRIIFYPVIAAAFSIVGGVISLAGGISVAYLSGYGGAMDIQMIVAAMHEMGDTAIATAGITAVVSLFL